MHQNHVFTFSRRSLLGGMLILPLSSFVPAQAEEAGSGDLGNLHLEICEPKIDSQSFQPLNQQPIYSGTSGEKVLQSASLPPSMTISNNGSEDVEQVSGTLSLQMRDTDTDIPSVGGAHKTRLQILNGDIELSYLDKDQWGAASYSWVLKRAIKSGESLQIDFRYYVDYPFANVDYELLVSAAILDQQGNNPLSQDQKMGSVPGFARYV